VTALTSHAGRKISVLEVLGNAIVGGMENYVRNLIRNLPVESYRVSIICPYESSFTRLLREEGYSVYIAPLRDDPPWRSIEMICSLIRSESIDILHAHLMNAFTVASIAGKLSGVPTVCTIHGMSLHPQEISLARITGSHLILVCREAWSQAIGVGLAAAKLSFVPNGIDVNTFCRDEGQRASLREKLGVEDVDILVGFVGRLAWEKGPDKFVKAAQLILDCSPKVRFVIAGDGPMRSQVAAAVSAAGLDRSVACLGMVTETRALYSALDLLLHTPRSDAMPLVVLEAMACSVPVVAIGVGGIPELIESGGTGILIGTNEWPGIVSEYPGDWEGVAKAALHLFDNPRLLKTMAVNSRERACRLFDIAQSASQTGEVFHEILKPILHDEIGGAEVVRIAKS
jgi:glycosyltransferase involved in cell wall biosynthesis